MQDQDIINEEERHEAATEEQTTLGISAEAEGRAAEQPLGQCPSLGPKVFPSGFDGVEPGQDTDGETARIEKMYDEAYGRLADCLKSEAEYLAGRIAALNRRACLYKGAPCAIRARAEITGIVTVLSALGWEVDCSWDQYDSNVALIPVAAVAEMKGGEK